jgi:hypothetical protein
VTTAATPSLLTWTIDGAHTEAGFAVKHLMISTVRGRFGDVKGTVSFDPANLATGSADVTIDVASIDTREAQRDAHLRSADFFETEKFPTLTFKSRRVQAVKADAFELVGDLTIKGITRGGPTWPSRASRKTRGQPEIGSPPQQDQLDCLRPDLNAALEQVRCLYDDVKISLDAVAEDRLVCRERDGRLATVTPPSQCLLYHIVKPFIIRPDLERRPHV